MAKPRGGYTRSVGKTDGTQISLPKRIVRHIAIMPSTSCGELRALFTRGLISQDTSIQCYENTHRVNSQAKFTDMRRAVIKILNTYGWTHIQIHENVRFYDSDIVSNCVKDANEWGKQLDWVYLDFCGVVDFDILMVLHDQWKANGFSSDAEISVTSNHKLRASTKTLKPILLDLSKYANRIDGYVRGMIPDGKDIAEIILGTQVGIAYALPFGAFVLESKTYARGMTTTRFARNKSAKRPHGIKLVFNGKAKVCKRPKQYRSLSPQEWAWCRANLNGCRYSN